MVPFWPLTFRTVTLPQPDLSVRPIPPDQQTPSDAVILTTAFDVLLDEELREDSREDSREVSGLHAAMTRSTPTAAIQRVAGMCSPFVGGRHCGARPMPCLAQGRWSSPGPTLAGVWLLQG